LLSPEVEGYEEFKNGELSFIKTKQLNMLNIADGMTVLETGFGRGELLYHCAKRGAKVAGVDLSVDAVEIAKEVLRDFPTADIRVADVTCLPYGENTFDRVFAGDVLEHLPFENGVKMLKEMYRVLKPRGIMLIHTSPNNIFTKWIYPVARLFLKFLDEEAIFIIDRQRQDLKIRKKNNCLTSHDHAHEYDLFSLKRVAKTADLNNPQVWVDGDILRSGNYRHTKVMGKNILVRFIGAIGSWGLLRCLLGNDLYLMSSKL